MVTFKDKIFFDWDKDKKTFSLQIRFISTANAGMNAE
jgi:hypothetical protein